MSLILKRTDQQMIDCLVLSWWHIHAITTPWKGMVQWLILAQPSSMLLYTPTLFPSLQPTFLNEIIALLETTSILYIQYNKSIVTWSSLCLVTVALIIQIYPGPFWLLRLYPAQLTYFAACSKLQNQIYILYIERLKLVITFQKNVFRLFRLPLLLISSKMQMHEDPFFFEPSILNIRTKYDITVEQRQLAFNYGMCNPESGDDRK